MEDIIDLNQVGEESLCSKGAAATKPDYTNSRYVEYNRWSSYPEIDSLVAYLIGKMGKKKADGYRMNMKVLVLDLYDSYLSDPEQFIGYHRGNDHYVFKGKAGKVDRYVKNPHIAKVSFVGCVDYLVTNGYLINKNGGHFYNETTNQYYGLLTKMRPTIKFAELCLQFKLAPRMIGKYIDEEVIIKKGKVKIRTINGKKVKIKKEVQYADTPKIVAMRKKVHDYNNYLEKCHIDIDAECMADTDKEEFARDLLERKSGRYEKIRLGSKRVYRVFNNDSFQQGGRYYGAWWIGCPSLLRKYITINGHKTVELDYSGIHIQLLYALKGVNYAALGEDAYSLIENDPDRELNKLILLTALNADGEKPTAQSIYNQLRKENQLGRYNIGSHEPIKLRLNQLKEKHPLVSDYIAKGYGVTLQYYDSCIIEKLIEYGVSHGISILTIHDSVICAEQYVDFIKDKMWQFYRDFAKERFGIDIKYKSIQPNAKPFFQNLTKSGGCQAPSMNYISAMGSIMGIDMEKYKYINGVYGKSSPIIKVKIEESKHGCSKECSQYKRVQQYKAKQYVFARDVIITVSDKDRMLIVG